MKENNQKTKNTENKSGKVSSVSIGVQYTIDAKNRSLGRVASEVALLLRGKDSPDFEKHLAPKNKVAIVNASKIKVSQKKMKDKIYRHYSGYPGGLKEETMQSLTIRRGYAEVFRHAIQGMLPDNRLRKLMMKNLTISD